MNQESALLHPPLTSRDYRPDLNKFRKNSSAPSYAAVAANSMEDLSSGDEDYTTATGNYCIDERFWQQVKKTIRLYV